MDPNVQGEYELLDSNRRFTAVFRIAKAVDGFERRLSTYFDPAKAEVKWPKIQEELKSGSELVALHWMQALASGAFPEDSHAISFLWATDGKIKEAIVCALVESAFAGYVLDERYLRPSRSKPTQISQKTPASSQA